MFLNKASDQNAKSIIKLLSNKAREHEGFRAFVYFLDGTPAQLLRLNKELKADNIALALLPEKERRETLSLYKINPSAQSTVFVYRSRKIEDKFVNFDAAKQSKALENAVDKVCRED